MEFITHTPEETISLGEKIGSCLKAGDILAMSGDLAAGKTTFTKGIAMALGVNDVVTSPTFCLISEYEGTRLPLYHMDVYRLEGTEDFINLGAEDLLYGEGICVVEWCEKVRTALPRRTIWITITSIPEGRKITIENWNNGSVE